MGKIVCISNQKGGVGKTTTAVNLSAALAAIGFKILLIDFDSQRNASVGVSCGVKEHNAYTFFMGKSTFEQAVHKTFIPNLYVIPSDMNLSAAEIEYANLKQRESILRNLLKDKSSSFDYVFIDCSPSFGILSLNALVAADCVLVPLQCEYYALEGLIFLLDNFLKVKKSFNNDLTIMGIVLTMYDKRSVLSSQIEKDVRKNLNYKVFKTVIPRNVKIAEAPSHGKPVLFYDIKCLGSLAYLDLAKEFLLRNGVESGR